MAARRRATTAGTGRSGGRRTGLQAPDDAVRSPTAVAAEALRTGVMPRVARAHRNGIPHEGSLLVGDPDDDTLANEYVGEDTPGGSTPTPDQNDVDEIGRAYGLQDEDGVVLRCASEVLSNRDKHRAELKAPRRPDR